MTSGHRAEKLFSMGFKRLRLGLFSFLCPRRLSVSPFVNIWFSVFIKTKSGLGRFSYLLLFTVLFFLHICEKNSNFELKMLNEYMDL